jgi:Raf kinase inhibitor-like YbhB/YbcL family protein
MNALRHVLGTLALCLVAGAACAAQAFTLTSPALRDGGRVPLSAVYTRCGGGNVSPALAWSHPPAGTKSFAVTVFDRDAPGGFWHWVVFEIPIGAHGLNTNAGAPHSGNAPGDAAQLPNDFGNHGYSGPCPPPGKPHHYVFTVYALDVPTLGITAHFSRKDALAAIRQHTLAKASLTAAWGR